MLRLQRGKVHVHLCRAADLQFTLNKKWGQGGNTQGVNGNGGQVGKPGAGGWGGGGNTKPSGANESKELAKARRDNEALRKEMANMKKDAGDPGNNGANATGNGTGTQTGGDPANSNAETQARIKDLRATKQQFEKLLHFFS